MIIKFMRFPESDGEVNLKHSDIAKKYLKSGWFFFDLVATFPFYLFDVGNAGTWFKLLRLIRIPRIMAVMDQSKFNKIVQQIFSG
jgi:hypothetical protein